MKKILFSALLLFIFTFNTFSQNKAADNLDTLIKQAEQKISGGDFVAAATSYYAAQKIAESQKNSHAICRIQTGLAKLNSESENTEGLRQSCLLGETSCRECKDTGNLAKIYLSDGVLYYKLQKLDSSAWYFNKSAELYLSLKDTIRWANASAKVGNVLEEQHRYPEALEYYLRYYQVAQKNQNNFYLLTANIYLTGNYLYQKRPKDAQRHNLEAQQLALQLKTNYEYSVTLQYEAMIYAQLEQYEKAYQAQDKYMNFYRDTIINAERIQQIEDLKAKYETAQKEAKIAIQDEKIKEQRTTLWAIASILALALIAGILLYRLTRKLRQRNVEKEFLIKEIHHRVKNNLQVLSSLLHLQSRHIKDDAALGAVREGQNRVEAMGLIHQKLYMGDNLASVEMKDYLENLGEALLDSFGIENERIQIICRLEPLYLDVDTAIPLGLIINELITNSLKYAFPEGKSGTIEIVLLKEASGKMCLTVSDNGVGKRSPEDPKSSTSFGANLVQMLSKKLKGKPEITTENGYKTTIYFENDKMA